MRLPNQHLQTHALRQAGLTRVTTLQWKKQNCLEQSRIEFWKEKHRGMKYGQVDKEAETLSSNIWLSCIKAECRREGLTEDDHDHGNNCYWPHGKVKMIAGWEPKLQVSSFIIGCDLSWLGKNFLNYSSTSRRPKYNIGKCGEDLAFCEEWWVGQYHVPLSALWSTTASHWRSISRSAPRLMHYMLHRLRLG